VGLPGLAKYFQEQSEEEREHAQKLMSYQVGLQITFRRGLLFLRLLPCTPPPKHTHTHTCMHAHALTYSSLFRTSHACTLALPHVGSLILVGMSFFTCCAQLWGIKAAMCVDGPLGLVGSVAKTGIGGERWRLHGFTSFSQRQWRSI
jgi:Ferritin-like domain